MKRCISILIALGMLFTFGTFAFAKSDIQAQLGYQHVSIAPDEADDVDTNGITFNVENYNLFDIVPDVFSVGFMDGLRVIGCDFGSDGDYDYMGLNVDFVIGPALGFQVKDIVKFQGMFGLDVGCKMLNTDYDDGEEDESQFDGGFQYGFATGIQAKFLPTSFVSPLVGFRYVKTFTELDSVDCDVDTMNVYLGCSLNFGL